MKKQLIPLLLSTIVASSAAVASEKFLYVVPLIPEPAALDVELAPAELPMAYVGQKYLVDLKPLLSVTSDTPLNTRKVTWTVEGSLPKGLALYDGVIHGTPKEGGVQTFKVKASVLSKGDVQEYEIITLRISIGMNVPAESPYGFVNEPFFFDLKETVQIENDAKVDKSQIVWKVVGNSLPPGLRLNADGTITGTPTEAKDGSITVLAEYKGESGRAKFQILSYDVSVQLRSADLPLAIVNDPYVGVNFNDFFDVRGFPGYDGSGVEWSVISGQLPPGLSLNPTTGQLSGTPTAAGTSFTIKASYRTVSGEQSYQLATATITVDIQNYQFKGPILSGTSYSADLSKLAVVKGDPYLNGLLNYRATGLPAGLTLSASGMLSGTPTQTGAFTPTITASYKGRTASKSYSMTVGGLVGGAVQEDGTLRLTAPAGTVFREIVFASWGTPSGNHPNFKQSGCHANITSKTNAAFIGKTTGSLWAHINNFGDPCGKTTKRLAVTLRAY